MNQIAQTTLHQFGGARRLGMMIGAHTFTEDGPTLGFRWRAKSRESLKCCTVTLDPSDTYTVKFFNRNGRVVHEANDIYNDQLIDLFERKTGLYLTVGVRT